ncbi:hypothetical protein [Rathayibacter sp. AY1C5]|uniref:hypothetical protein n=1 Tax=Rathayibacter sp. AY1C5 TaxID=2080538 RepID=UPI000CE8F37E|nr:hypothetical protein [Rathayibacter sp. AY1C5]PPG60281.1 hypothetical protein C5C57_05630 [Rathayibacter sp. AY1C5]
MIWLRYRDEQGWDDMNDEEERIGRNEATDYIGGVGVELYKYVNGQVFINVLNEDGTVTEWSESDPSSRWGGTWRTSHPQGPMKYFNPTLRITINGHVVTVEKRAHEGWVLEESHEGRSSDVRFERR